MAQGKQMGYKKAVCKLAQCATYQRLALHRGINLLAGQNFSIKTDWHWAILFYLDPKQIKGNVGRQWYDSHRDLVKKEAMRVHVPKDRDRGG